MKLIVGVKTDVGHVREGNEDSYLAEMPVFAVADGMGGHVAGDVASTTAIEVLIAHSKELIADPEKVKDILRDANRAIWEKSNSDPSLRGMGTTCTMLLFDDGTAHIAHVGDSRAYLFRGGELVQQTRDHTLVDRMVQEGKLTNEEAAHHPHRNIITNALGIEPDVEVDFFSLELQEGDRFIICSDGLTSMIDEETFRTILADGQDPQGTTEKLVQAALDEGGEDNVTVIILEAAEGKGVEIRPPEPPAPPAPRVDTEPEAAPKRERGEGGGSGSRMGRRLLWIGLVVLLLAGAGYAALRFTLTNSWFVGVSDDGFVTIYQGIPEEVAGFEFKEIEQETGLALTDLPDFLRADVREGQKVDSLDEAEETVDNLRARAREALRERNQQTKDTKKQ